MGSISNMIFLTNRCLSFSTLHSILYAYQVGNPSIEGVCWWQHFVQEPVSLSGPHQSNQLIYKDDVKIVEEQNEYLIDTVGEA